MSKDTIQYQNALTEQYDHCYIEESEFGKQYIDKESKRTLILYQKPLGQTLVGLDLDQVETGQAYLKRELRARLEEAISYSNSNTPVITIFTDTLARILAGLGSPLSKEAEAVMNLTADRRPGKNQARLRDHCLLTSGVATALARTMLLRTCSKSFQ